MGTIKTIIALGLAAAAALYVHSTYIAAKEQRDVPEYIAAGSKIIRDSKKLGETGKFVYDSIADAINEMNEHAKKEGDGIDAIADNQGNAPYEK